MFIHFPLNHDSRKKRKKERSKKKKHKSFPAHSVETWFLYVPLPKRVIATPGLPQPPQPPKPPKNVQRKTTGFFRVFLGGSKKVSPKHFGEFFSHPPCPLAAVPCVFRFPFLPVEGHQGMGIFPIIAIERLTQLLQGNLTSSRSARFVFRQERETKKHGPVGVPLVFFLKKNSVMWGVS